MVEMQVPKIELTASAENYGRFVIEPLEAGFGTTLGNALRRVLLSSLPGAAITSVRIEEVQHEFSVIPHVREDTTELLLNIRGIRLRAFSDRPGKLLLEAQGEGRVTAADIRTSADYEIVNPELYLATLDSPDAKLTIEFNVERGKGYVPASHRDGLPIGMIPVDAIFTPMRKVNYVVEHTRVGPQTNFDKLTLEIWTDGTITPSDALSQSAQILTRYLSLLGDLGRVSPRPDKQAAAVSPIPSKVYDTPIEELDLSVRAYNCLKRSGITKVGQILEMNEEDLLSVRNFGRKSLDELRERLAARGFLPEGEGMGEGGQESAEGRVAVAEPEEEDYEDYEEDEEEVEEEE